MKKAPLVTAPAVLFLALLALSSCGRPASVEGLKTALVKLAIAGEAANTRLGDYQSLVMDAKAKFESAKADVNAGNAAAIGGALAKAADVETVWRGTETIDGGLSSSLRAPLTRLGVVKDDEDFRKHSDIFIAFEEDPDDDRPQDTEEKKAGLAAARADLLKEARHSADAALTEAAGGL